MYPISQDKYLIYSKPLPEVLECPEMYMTIIVCHLFLNPYNMYFADVSVHGQAASTRNKQ